MYVVVVSQERQPSQGVRVGSLRFSATTIEANPIMANTYYWFLRRRAAYAASVMPGEFPSSTATVYPLLRGPRV
jgi:hypothetical protein